MDMGDVDNFGPSKGGWEIDACYIKFEAAAGNSLGYDIVSKILTPDAAGAFHMVYGRSYDPGRPDRRREDAAGRDLRAGVHGDLRRPGP